MKTPLIFVHFGDTHYLKYVLKSAVRSGNKTILIGDESNRKYKNYGIDHYIFDDYLQNPSAHRLSEVYRRVGGTSFSEINAHKGARDWTKFNFQKWIVLEEFCKLNELSGFWTFDSDTLIFSDLNQLNDYFEEYSYSTMNEHNQLQGKLNDISVLSSFNKLVIDLFENESFLEDLMKTDFQKNPTWGFTMMRVFESLKIQEGYNTIRLKDVVIDGATFDECICMPFQMEIYESEIGRSLKMLYANGSGNIFEKVINEPTYLKLHSLNLSWVPDYHFDIVYKEFIHSKARDWSMRAIVFNRNIIDKISFKIRTKLS
ncbi:MAG: hypothetical protein RIA69_02895 [Cyclobacteriaceae bacterium]